MSFLAPSKSQAASCDCFRATSSRWIEASLAQQKLPRRDSRPVNSRGRPPALCVIRRGLARPGALSSASSPLMLRVSLRLDASKPCGAHPLDLWDSVVAEGDTAHCLGSKPAKRTSGETFCLVDANELDDQDGELSHRLAPSLFDLPSILSAFRFCVVKRSSTPPLG